MTVISQVLCSIVPSTGGANHGRLSPRGHHVTNPPLAGPCLSLSGT